MAADFTANEERCPASCSECRFFDELTTDMTATKGYGHCRRQPPTPDGMFKGKFLKGSWPLVAACDWCGAGSTGLRG
jgi:hypothetical protein